MCSGMECALLCWKECCCLFFLRGLGTRVDWTSVLLGVLSCYHPGWWLDTCLVGDWTCVVLCLWLVVIMSLVVAN